MNQRNEISFEEKQRLCQAALSSANKPSTIEDLNGKYLKNKFLVNSLLLLLLHSNEFFQLNIKNLLANRSHPAENKRCMISLEWKIFGEMEIYIFLYPNGQPALANHSIDFLLCVHIM